MELHRCTILQINRRKLDHLYGQSRLTAVYHCLLLHHFPSLIFSNTNKEWCFIADWIKLKEHVVDGNYKCRLLRMSSCSMQECICGYNANERIHWSFCQSSHVARNIWKDRESAIPIRIPLENWIFFYFDLPLCTYFWIFPKCNINYYHIFNNQ